MDQDILGKVTHYYDKAGVVIVRLNKNLKVGDRVKFVKGDNVFEQVVDSMQVEHSSLPEAKAGEEIGIKVNQKTKEGTTVYLVAPQPL